MRLAADYQQANKNNNKKDKQTNQKINVVRLGRGLAIQEKKKRGISISQSNQKIRQVSLGRNEVSKQKKMELNMISSKYSNQHPIIKNLQKSSNPEINIISSSANYGQKQQISSPINYKNQITHNHFIRRDPAFQNPQRNIKEVKSQSILKRSPNFINHNINQVYHQQKFVPKHNQNFKNHIYSGQFKNGLSNELKTISSIQKITFLPVNSINSLSSKLQESSSNSNSRVSPSKIQIKYINPVRISKNNPPQHQITPSKHQKIFTDYQTMHKQPNQKVISIHVKTNPKEFYNEIYYKNQQLRNTLKNQDRPKRSYQNQHLHLINSNATQKIKNSMNLQTQTNNKQSLVVTKKKYLANINQIKEIPSLSDINQYSRSRISTNSKGQGFINLWDANKTQSIVSLTQSRQIKVQQSQIMLDYFNPPDQILQKI